VIRARGLAKRYGAKRIFEGLDLDVERGAFVVVTGPNGSGKTTLMRLIAGLIVPTAGELEVDAERAQLGFLGHEALVYRDLTAMENLQLYARLYRVLEARERIGMLLERFDLWDVRNERAGSYSRGMLQRLALCRTFLHDPTLLLLDEPYSALDAEGAELLDRGQDVPRPLRAPMARRVDDERSLRQRAARRGRPRARVDVAVRHEARACREEAREIRVEVVDTVREHVEARDRLALGRVGLGRVVPGVDLGGDRRLPPPADVALARVVALVGDADSLSGPPQECDVAHRDRAGIGRVSATERAVLARGDRWEDRLSEIEVHDVEVPQRAPEKEVALRLELEAARCEHLVGLVGERRLRERDRPAVEPELALRAREPLRVPADGRRAMEDADRHAHNRR